MNLTNNNLQADFFRNREFNQIYASVFIMIFGESLINIFVPIYFFNLGFKVHQILFFYFLISLYFLLFSYAGAKIVSKIGRKHAILLSAPFLIFYYIGLEYIDLHKILFYLLPLFLSLRLVLFNYGYHLLFLDYSDKNKRGRELAFSGAIILIASTAAPYLGGYFASINFTIIFTISSILIIVGTAPLFFTKDSFKKINFTISSIYKRAFSKENAGNLISFSGYAVESVIGRTVWPIFIIIIVGSVYKTGLLISASMVLSLVFFYFIGKITDKISKIRLIKIGNVLYFFGWVGRIFANSFCSLLLVDSYKNISEQMLHLPWSAHSYDLAKRGDCFEFIVLREIIFNISRVVIFPILILIFWIDFFPFTVSFLVAGFFSLGYLFINK